MGVKYHINQMPICQFIQRCLAHSPLIHPRCSPLACISITQLLLLTDELVDISR